MDFQEIKQLLQNDLQAVDTLILEKLHSNVVLVNQIGHYIVNSGGKRIRPLLVVLTANAFSYQGHQHIDLAAIVEFIHTATLLHDDVVDESTLRRGRETANALFGNQASVLVGDFLYSRAFQMMVDVGAMRVMNILSDATNRIAEGEVLQLINCHDPDTTEASYLDVIHCKTAKLFEAATQLGALIANQPDAIEETMARFGMHLGTAFQLIDDVLDYEASVEELGKNIGDDLAEGKPTLPLIHAIKHGNADQVAVIRQAIEDGGLENFEIIKQAIEVTGAIAYTRQVAQAEVEKALHCLEVVPDSPYKTALQSLTALSLNRTS